MKNTRLYALALLVAGGFAAGSAQAQDSEPFDVTIEILESCTIISATDVIFDPVIPTAGTVNSATNGTITVECTAGSDFSLALDGGTTTGDPTARAMAGTGGNAAATDTIAYTLSNDSAGGAAWGEGADAVTDVGLGLGAANQIEYTVYGQATLLGTEPSGTYLDTVTAELTLL